MFHPTIIGLELKTHRSQFIMEIVYLFGLLVTTIPSGSWTIPSSLTKFVYYNQSVTWDEAHHVCIQDGGSLVHIEDSSKQTVVMETLKDLDPTNSDYLWLGQVRPTVEGRRFIRLDTCGILDWAKWEIGHPDEQSLGQCVRLGMPHGNWEQTSCSAKARILCEKETGGNCFYSSVPNLTLITNNIRIEASLDIPLTQTCGEMCDGRILNGKECWAFSEENTLFNPPGICNLYFGPEQNLVQNSSLFQAHTGMDLNLKQCFSAQYGGAVVGPNVTGLKWNYYDCATDTFSLLPLEDCECPCEPLSAEESRKFIQEIITSLTINISNLSSVRRRYYSAVHDDVVSLSIGYSGVVFIVIFVVVILLCDIDVLLRGRKKT